MFSGIRKGIFTPMPSIGKVSLAYSGNPYSLFIIQSLLSIMLSSLWKMEFIQLMLE
jgi:hypothetical protein